MTTPKTGKEPLRTLPEDARVDEGLDRLYRERAIHTLVRGGLPLDTLKRLLRGRMPKRKDENVAAETWVSMAVELAGDVGEFGYELAQALHDRLGWDHEPGSIEEWERVARERPLEALWMAALSDDKAMRKAFPRFAAECVRSFRASPECVAPTWEFVDGVLDSYSHVLRELREAQKLAEDAARRQEAERERLDELREELKRLRRENSDLRGEKAQAERRAQSLEQELRSRAGGAPHDGRIEELERRLRKAEKEREHLFRELERLRGAAAGATPDETEDLDAGPEAVGEAEPGPAGPPITDDPNPRRRVLRQMLRKLLNKGKVGGSHTHEDNVYRGVADHEKGTAKEAMELLYREGLFMPKPTTTDPHVSISPERTSEVKAIIRGEISNPRLQRWVES